MNKENKEFLKLIRLMEKLRSKDGCEWDKSMTMKKLRENIVEEAYELVSAITNDDEDNIKEELGDYLLQVIFASQIMKEKGIFDIYNVIRFLNKKLIRRHPHVFKGKKALTAEDAKKHWDSMKKEEKQKVNELNEQKKFPALMESYNISKIASRMNFDWKDYKGIIKKIKEEIEELVDAVKKEDKKQIEEEIGDILFTVANLSRNLGINPEIALKNANDKFKRRFKKLLERLEKEEKISIYKMNKIWDYIKSNE